MQGNISIRDIYKSYGSYIALDHVSIDVKAGEFLTLLGPSGSGKTTLLNVLAGFIRPESGSILVDGEEFLTKPPHQRNLGMVFQNYALFPHMNVFDNVAYPLRLRKVARADIETRVKNALALVKMEHLSERGIGQLSGGQRQRVALARAMVFEPKILLMDEPLSALDKKLREHMQLELKRLHERLGMTTIYVTHDQKEALTMSDRIAILSNGKVAQLDTPAAIYEQPVNRFVADFIGESSFLPVNSSNGGLTLYGRELHTSRPWQGGAASYWLAVRAEKLLWRAPEAGGYNLIEGVASDIVYQGDCHLITMRLSDGTMIAARRSMGEADALPSRGDSLRFWLHPDETIVVADA
nr:ABC transporter ATP-binding protein [uncultured Pseudogulbenkiania sp.]